MLGYEGKWAIHPSQIELANKVFTPSDAEVTKARRIMEAMAQAARAGKGAVSLDGRLIDIASIRMAEALTGDSQRDCRIEAVVQALAAAARRPARAFVSRHAAIIESAERSMSSSVVGHAMTDTRITSRSRQRVPPA